MNELYIVYSVEYNGEYSFDHVYCILTNEAAAQKMVNDYMEIWRKNKEKNGWNGDNTLYYDKVIIGKVYDIFY